MYDCDPYIVCIFVFTALIHCIVHVCVIIITGIDLIIIFVVIHTTCNHTVLARLRLNYEVELLSVENVHKIATVASEYYFDLATRRDVGNGLRKNRGQVGRI